MKSVVALLVAASYVNAHMRMLFPLPRGHPQNVKYQAIDYDLVAPLDPKAPNPKTFPCGGKVVKGPVTARFKAGETVTVQLEGSATHGGGHCQFALSCNGQNNKFVVIKSVVETCPLEKSYQVQIPESAKGDCVFTWTWFNKIGNREMYSNCADIAIDNPSGSGQFSGPPLTILNLPGYDTMPEGGSSPFDERGMPNFRYGRKATENFVTGLIGSNGAAETAAPPAPAPAAPIVAAPVVTSSPTPPSPVAATTDDTSALTLVSAKPSFVEEDVAGNLLQQIKVALKGIVDKAKVTFSGNKEINSVLQKVNIN